MKHIAKNWLFVAFVVVLTAAATAAFGADASANGLALVPLPQKVQRMDGAFTLNAQTRIYTDAASRKTAEFLAQRLRQSTGYPLPVHRKIIGGIPPNSIFFTTKHANKAVGDEGYDLTVSPIGVVIRAPTEAGVFYGGETLMQLFPPEIFSTNVENHPVIRGELLFAADTNFSTNIVSAVWQAPCVQIEDWPRFSWRGVMLDVSRHFYNKTEVEAILDTMALYKLNRFHWHLVDDDGWRLEVDKYPKLTEIGAWRHDVQLQRTHRTDDEPTAHPAWTQASADKFGPDGKYGGFYTPQDIREVVAYAAARHIMVVPEIEMPGHSGEVVASYPELGCSGKPYDVEKPGPFHVGVLDPANPEVFTFLDNVLDEVFELFPGPYVHIGGDEVPRGAWNRYDDCRALMQKEGLENEGQLQTWFTTKMVSYISAHGKTPIGWSEAIRGGITTNLVVMDWIGGGKKAAEQGHDAIMTPSSPVDYAYFDHYQSTNHLTEPRAIGGYLPLSRVYAFEPVPEGLPADLQSHILGPQGNLWTEYVASLPHAQYMIFPRACAMAEVGWSAKDARNWDDFQKRMTMDEQRLDKLGVNYRRLEPPPVRATRITTDFIDANVSLDYPGFTGLSLDSLGKEHFPLVKIETPGNPQPTESVQKGSRVEYRKPGASDSQPPRWSIEVDKDGIVLESHWTADDLPEPLALDLVNRVCHPTLLGLMDNDGSIRLPALLHFADQGTFRISANSANAGPLGYSGRHGKGPVHISFPGATADNPEVTYHLQVVTVHPEIPGIESDPRFDGFRRNWLNILQYSPENRMLANNVTSDTCGFCFYEYADVARATPPLADGVTALDMVRQSLDRIIAGAFAYGFFDTSKDPHHPKYASDTLPSFLIAADDYVEGSKDDNWLAQNYSHIKAWADEMLATDTNGDGLIKFPLSGNSGSWPWPIKYRPANWWDTIGFGYEDAYANALAYRALRGMQTMAQQAGHSDDASQYGAAADKLKAAYFDAFYNPKTGVLAGWRSQDGQLHDYYFLYVNGIAIHYGLVPTDKANDIMDKLLAKMNEVGFTNFELGLPGNLVSVARKDYVDLRVRFGGGITPENSDGFQIYENGGATACFAYFTLAALYDLGRINDGDRILMPMLKAFYDGDFQGFGPNGLSKDWKMWDGTCKGYEGLLTDNYYALLAVMDRQAAVEKAAGR
ncbi:MAG TPA: family 20 glycosylhydrolase [Candidatus Acidoferrales bacterium]|nr:family 20 glycosylhydrolase [Candidatus Acidoferrales bacterium]